jgi:octaprenyl-diphosphate synthase
MKELGENVGIAFQIRDDLLDYETNGLTGKIVGNDIKERKLTLPLIHALEIASASQRNQIMSVVKRKKKTRDEIKEVIDFVTSYGGLEYAELKMNLFRDKALAILDSYPDSVYKDSLKKFVFFTTSRNK